MAERNIVTVKELSEISGVSRMTLHKLINRDATGIGVETIISLCDALECGIGDLLKKVDEQEYENIMKIKSKRISRRKKGHVYVIKDPDIQLYKIGRSSDFNKRLKMLSSEFKSELETVLLIPTNDTISLEKEIHDYFDDLRFTGEWFKLTEQDIGEIKDKFGGRRNG